MAETDGGARGHIVERLAEIRGLVHRGAAATGRQAEGAALLGAPGAGQAVRELHDRLEQQSFGLERRLAMLGGSPERAATAGAAGPPSDVGRASEEIGADGEFLQRLSLAYLRLQSAGRSLGDEETSGLAERGYEDTQSLLRDLIGRARPRAAAADHAAADHTSPGPRPRETVDSEEDA